MTFWHLKCTEIPEPLHKRNTAIMKIFETLKTNLFTQTIHRLHTEASHDHPSGIPVPTSLPPNKIANFPPVDTPDRPTGDHLSVAELSFQLDILEKQHLGDLHWRTSIVDLLKIVDMDSSLEARKELAQELGYSQSDIDSKGSEEMNTWLHTKVLEKLSEDTDGELSAI